MHAEPPPAPVSKDLNNGPRSSQLDRRMTGMDPVAGFEKSGSRNGLDFSRALTESGSTCFSASSGANS